MSQSSAPSWTASALVIAVIPRCRRPRPPRGTVEVESTVKRLPTMAVDDLGTSGSPIATTFDQLFATNTACDLEGTITHFSLATTNVDATLGRAFVSFDALTAPAEQHGDNAEVPRPLPPAQRYAGRGDTLAPWRPGAPRVNGNVSRTATCVGGRSRSTWSLMTTTGLGGRHRLRWSTRSSSLPILGPGRRGARDRLRYGPAKRAAGRAWCGPDSDRARPSAWHAGASEPCGVPERACRAQWIRGLAATRDALRCGGVRQCLPLARPSGAGLEVCRSLPPGRITRDPANAPRERRYNSASSRRRNRAM